MGLPHGERLELEQGRVAGGRRPSRASLRTRAPSEIRNDPLDIGMAVASPTTPEHSPVNINATRGRRPHQLGASANANSIRAANARLVAGPPAANKANFLITSRLSVGSEEATPPNRAGSRLSRKRTLPESPRSSRSGPMTKKLKPKSDKPAREHVAQLASQKGDARCENENRDQAQEEPPVTRQQPERWTHQRCDRDRRECTTVRLGLDHAFAV